MSCSSAAARRVSSKGSHSATRYVSPDIDWTVVGVFEAGGGAVESEIWTDLPMLQSAFRLGNGVNSVRVKPSSAQHGGVFRRSR